MRFAYTRPSPSRYLHYLSVSGSGERFARAFRLFADEASYPTLIHCTAGKDRTGVLVGLLMEVLGASEDDIAAEYGLSNESIDRLLAYLAHHRGRVVSRTELVEHLYDQDFDRDSNTIEVFVGRLRKKLDPNLIQTVRGLGYCLEHSDAASHEARAKA